MYEKLDAKIGDKVYNISDFDSEDGGIFVKIIDIKDFDNDGYDDALIEENCGGNTCPFSIITFCTYNHKNDVFKFVENFGSIVEDAKIELWQGQLSVSFTSYEIMGMYRAFERYILKDGSPVRVELDEAKYLKAKVEMLAEYFTESEMNDGKILKYDLDGDGKTDEIITE